METQFQKNPGHAEYHISLSDFYKFNQVCFCWKTQGNIDKVLYLNQHMCKMPRKILCDAVFRMLDYGFVVAVSKEVTFL